MTQRLDRLQALRAVAAIAVLLFHLNVYVAPDVLGAAGSLWSGLSMGYAGVEIFFVLSGFIMVFAHRGDFGAPGRFARFARKRLVRIYPFFWAMLAATVIARIALGDPAPGAGALAEAALLIPNFTDPIITVAWSLSFEMMFYAIFSLAILNAAFGAAAGALWFGATLAALILGHESALTIFLLSPYNLLFLMGIGAAYAYRSIPPAAARLAAAIGGAAFIFIGLTELYGTLDYDKGWRTALFGLAATAVVAGLAALDARGRGRVPVWAVFLGDASYAIYLAHIPAMTATAKILVALGLGGAALPLPLSFAILTSAGLAGGIVAHLALEKPILSWLRRRLDNRAPAAG